MARFLIAMKNPDKGNVVGAFPNDHVFGANEDIFENEKKNGDRSKWTGDFAIVDIADMDMAEALALAEPVITTEDSTEIDEITGLPFQITVIHYNSAGNFDVDRMAKTGPEKQKLKDDWTVVISRVEALPDITVRVAP